MRNELCNSLPPRACCTLGDMIIEDALNETGLRFADNGVIPAHLLTDARDNLMETIRDLEKSPQGPSSKNGPVLALLRNSCTNRLGKIVTYICKAIENGHTVAMEELRNCALPRAVSVMRRKISFASASPADPRALKIN